MKVMLVEVQPKGRPAAPVNGARPGRTRLSPYTGKLPPYTMRLRPARQGVAVLRLLAQ